MARINLPKKIKYNVLNVLIDDRNLLTKNQNLKNTLRRVLTKEEKLEFVKTSVSWISGKEIMDTFFVLNFGYEAPLPWPQV